MSQYKITGCIGDFEGMLKGVRLELIMMKKDWDSMTGKQQMKALKSYGRLIAENYYTENIGKISKVVVEGLE